MNTSNSNEKRALTLFVSLALAISAVATALRIINLAFFYDSDIGYYVSGAILPTVFNIFYALAVVFFGIASFFLIKTESQIAPPDKASCLAALIPAAALAVQAIALLIDAFKGLDGEALDLYSLLILVFAIVSVVFFVSLAFCKQPSNLTVISGVGVVLWLAVSWIKSYLDVYVAMNSPDKILFHLGCIGALLFVVAELRSIYLISKPKLYWFSIFCAIFSLSVASIPSIIAGINGTIERYTLQYENIFFLALLAYALVRALTLVRATDNNPIPDGQNSPTNEKSNDTQD